MKTCRKGLHLIHGANVYVRPSGGHPRCRACKNSYRQRWQKANRQKKRMSNLRQRARIYRLLGRTRCVVCGSRARLEFHHRDPRTKKFTIGDSNNLRRPLAELKREARKCVVLCRACHMQQHQKIAA
jgi:hypothetical protein